MGASVSREHFISCDGANARFQVYGERTRRQLAQCGGEQTNLAPRFHDIVMYFPFSVWNTHDAGLRSSRKWRRRTGIDGYLAISNDAHMTETTWYTVTVDLREKYIELIGPNESPANVSSGFYALYPPSCLQGYKKRGGPGDFIGAVDATFFTHQKPVPEHRVFSDIDAEDKE